MGESKMKVGNLAKLNAPLTKRPASLAGASTGYCREILLLVDTLAVPEVQDGVKIEKVCAHTLPCAPSPCPAPLRGFCQ